MTNRREKKLLDRVRDAIRTKHYSIRTEEAYANWIKRFILFHDKRHPQEMGAAEIEEFLTHLAVDKNVAASTQNQALSAILFLYQEVLHQDLERPLDAVRAKKPKRLPTVLTKEEAQQVLAAMSGTYQLIAKLLYGSGLRLIECLRLRVKACPERSRRDIDFSQRQACAEPVEASSCATARAEKTTSPCSPTAFSLRRSGPCTALPVTTCHIRSGRSAGHPLALKHSLR